MDFKKSEEQELLLESLKELMERECPEDYVRRCDEEGRFPVEFAKALVDNGFGLLGVPEEYGGTPVDLLTLLLVKEEIAKNGGPINVFTQAFQLDNMLTYGSEEQKKITMDYVKQGQVPFCIGFTEPQAGSDTSAIQTSYTRKNGKVYLNGHKTFISGALTNPYLLCMARNCDETDKTKAFTMWWVPMSAPGIKVEQLHKIGWHMLETCEIYLENVAVEEKDIVGQEGHGFLQLMKNFETERLLMASTILGMAECAFEDAVRYANQRVQFGKPIGTFQLIQEKITYMALKIENMRNLIYKTAWEKENGISTQITSALTKLYCAQSGNEIIDDALQIMSGIGYTNDCRISRLWRDARNYRIGGGTDQVMIHIAGRNILKKYK
ncbi:acyl-CoA dehydrogenase [Desulfitobacterium chlororespirans]|uniref:Acyl-CoA dehydrogenase n=1 Tax=Desulfitobacterium chlororespirans DSM 11544 TaxID=1121395 RepID=A0A1M7UAY2_9FIRM|nr:acyl-CoA dehydrogenase [Desulfitobacterium chlororespirans]SHN80075.1 Acyl-CoA dehydrogenase [Desulfitobacterium chlororespirans DSM 11544]